MWWLNCSTLYAGVFSCVFHILLLGFAASVSVALPGQPSTHIRVTFLQQPVPLPIQELPKGEEQPKEIPASQPPPPKIPQPRRAVSRPVTEKKPAPIRPPKPIAKPKRVPLPESSPVAKEDPSQVVLETSPVSVAPVPEGSPALADEHFSTVSEKVGDGDTSTGASAEGTTHFAGRTSGGGHGGGTAGGSGLSATPDYNVNPKPPYPLIARRIGAQGEVLLRVLVRTDGSVATVELARSSGFSLLDESATRTVRDNWRFVPAQVDGALVESWVEVPIKFILADS